MPPIQKVRVYKYKNIAAALAVVLLALVALSTNVGSGSAKKHTNSKNNTSVSSKSEKKSAKKADKDDDVRLTKNYKYEEFKNGTTPNSGYLVTVDSDQPYTGSPFDTDGIYSYLFDEAGNQIMYASSTMIYGETEMLEHLNQMAVDFAADTGLRTLMISQLIPDDGSDSKYDEAYIGTCADLMIYNGSFDPFTAEGDYGWLTENCYKYGFIFRGNSRIRYVGVPVSEYLKSSGSDLETFMEAVKKYKFEKPLYFTDENDKEFAFYFIDVSSGDTTTNVPIPLRQDDSEYGYDISGNNEDGYVVCVNLTDNEDFDNYYEQSQEEDRQDAETDETVNG